MTVTTSFLLFIFIVLLTFLPSAWVQAETQEDVDAIIEKMQTPSWDCPDPSLYSELENTLALTTLDAQQRFALTAAKGQFLICEGKYTQALAMLQNATAQENIDKLSYAYASAIYQIGFVYDVLENPTRCDFYAQAQRMSSPQLHSDIFTSSSLGLITYCSENADDAERLGKMFSVLQRYSNNGSPAELAHIHNSIGLLYGNLQQHALAAEQYLKAHEMGLKIYKGSNKLSVLISAIVSLLASGQVDEAYQRIIEFDKINQEVNTPLTNYHYQYALSFYYLKTKNYAQLEAVLPDLKNAVSAISSSLAKLIYRWYETEVCIFNNDLHCIRDYLESVAQGTNYIPQNFSSNLDYLSFNLAMYIALDDIQNARIARELFAAEASKRLVANQDSARILSAANLHNRIFDLESEIKMVEKNRRNTLLVVLAFFVLLMAVATYILRKRYQARQAIDPVTQVLNAKTAIARINKLTPTSTNRVIAIAIFDISNLREITAKLGSTQGDDVMHKIAQTLRQSTRGNDILGRLGTEQFILCLHNIDEYQARSFFERAQLNLQKTFEHQSDNISIAVKSNKSVFISHEKLADLDTIINEMVMSIDKSNPCEGS